MSKTDRPAENEETAQPSEDEHRHKAPEDDDEGRRKGGKLGIDEIARALKVMLDLRSLGGDASERLVEGFFRLLNRRDILERLLRSEFMRNVKDMQSEITESIGIASQADVQDIKKRLDEVNQRLDKLQITLDEIVVEVDDS